jgi:VIT1/CCC1 family predicted Fe2+/Mn2+ transporter
MQRRYAEAIRREQQHGRNSLWLTLAVIVPMLGLVITAAVLHSTALALIVVFVMLAVLMAVAVVSYFKSKQWPARTHKVAA